MELFTAIALVDISYNIIASLLYDAGRFGLSFAGSAELEDIFEQALKDSVKDLKKEPARELRQVFKTREVQEKIWAFQHYGEIIPMEFFADMFEKVVGKTHAKQLAKNLFVHFRQRLAKKETLVREIQLLASDLLLIHAQKREKHDEETRKLLHEILAAVKKQKNIEATIGYQEIPPLPEDYVAPQMTLSAVKSQLTQKNVVLVWGSPGAGKSVLVTALAREAAAAQRPVFWFRFQRLLTDLKAVQSNLLPFLQNEIGELSENLPALLAKSRALLIFDDLQHAGDDELQRFLATIASLLAGSGNKDCQMLFTSRERSAFLPVEKIALYRHEGLAPTEAEALMTGKWQLALSVAQQKRALEILNCRPQYLQFFHQWHLLAQPDEERLARYFAHVPSEDENMQDYLMRELYEALGGAESNANKLLLAVAFYRIPERKDFIERLFGELQGEKFGETLHLAQNRKGLLQYLSKAQRYTLHDVLREFYYQQAEAKSRLHACCAAWYQERLRSDADLIDHIEGAHHFRKAGDHQAAATLLRPVTHHCTTHGYYWQPLRDILECLDLKTISDEELIFATIYDLGNLQLFMGAWDAALWSFSQCLQMQSQQDLHHYVYNSLGLVYQSKGEWDKAIEFYQKSLDCKETVGDVHDMAQTYGNLGNVYQLKGEWDKAVDFYQKSLEGLEKVGDILGMAQTHGNLGIVYQRKGEWDKAIEFYQKSLAGKEKVGDIHGMAQTYVNWGAVYQLKGQWDKAIDVCQKSLDRLKQVGDIYGIAQIYIILGNVYQLKGEWDNAITFYQQSLNRFEKVDAFHEIAQTYLCFGNIYQLKGEWDTAITFYQQSLDRFEKVDAVHGIAQTYICFGNIYQLKGEWDKAIEFYQKSLQGLEKVGDILGMAQTYDNLGNICQLKGEWNNAIEFYQKSLEGKEKVGDIHGMAQTYSNLGIIYANKGEWDKAIEFFLKDLEISEQVGDIHAVSKTYGNLGVVYKNKGEWDKAIEFYQKSLDGYEKVGDVYGMAQTYCNVGLLYFHQQQYPEAIRLLIEALFLFIKLGAAPQVQQATAILEGFQDRLGGKEFGHSFNETLRGILANGITWSRHQVVTKEEAQKIGQKLSRKENKA
ncbi:MAG: tetratricopeptide repeat protein [bacterium]